MNRITIAIDGYAGCGKSSTAKRVARELQYLYIDTGAMYRAVTLYFLDHGIDCHTETPAMIEALGKIQISFRDGLEPGSRETLLNGEPVELAIRQPRVSEAVSPVSVHHAVRSAMVQQQQRIGAGGGVVMDGRDIGTVVFPLAELKLFMTAEIRVRAERRRQEQAERGIEESIDSILENLRKRDLIDSTRKEGPLRKAEDAIELDTTEMSFDDQVAFVCRLARERMRPEVPEVS
ncbi:MAG: (d)CMP kinase [Bacteroidia bacterium]|nr:(d)CMP kinase [Bacteroidia bacterium]